MDKTEENKPKQNATGDVPQKPGHKSKKLVAILLVTLTAVSLILLIALAFASKKSLISAQIGNSKINTNQPVEKIESDITSQVSAYKIAIVSSEKTTEYSLEEAGITVDSATTAQEIVKAQKPDNYLKRLGWWQEANVELVLEIDQAKLEEFIKKNAELITAAPKNATLKISEGEIIVTPDKSGKAYTIDNPEETIKQKIANLDSTPLKLTEQVISADITAENTVTAQQKIKQMLKRKIIVEIEDKKFAATPSRIGEWIDIEPAPDQNTIDTGVNSGKVLKWIDEIAKPYTNPPQNKVIVKNSSGSTVVTPGINGRDVVNKSALAKDIAKAANAGNDITVAASIDYAEYETITAKTYPKWIEVDTGSKKLYAYENNKLVRTYLISAGAPATPTPTGTFKIFSKVRIQDMRGNNVDGSRYFQPDVEWVNYFAAGGYAIHGNYWRPVSWFGNINSSHGCVGLLNGPAQWIYNWAPIGTPVVVHR